MNDLSAVRRLFSTAVLLSILALSVAAQEVRIGGLEGTTQVFTGTPITIIDWSRPASASGTVNTASVGWVDAATPCDNIFFVRFYVVPSNALGATMLAERGPFRAVNGINTVTLNPPVNVTPEMYIGVRRVDGPESCGKPYGTFTRKPGRALASSADFQNGSLQSLTPLPNYTLQAQASTSDFLRVSTLPVVGSAHGNGSSFFRTSLTLVNPSAQELHGKLVMRLAGRSGTDADPSLEFTLGPNETRNYADVIEAMNQSGLGSLDIYTKASVTPIVNARVFNDAGEKGTSGLSEDAVPAGAVYDNRATVMVPADLTKFRLNIGLRTITRVDLTIQVYDASGALQRTVFKSYDPNFFNQFAATDFAGGDVPAGGKIVASAFEKEFIVYGAVTDNTTNDPSMRIGLD